MEGARCPYCMALLRADGTCSSCNALASDYIPLLHHLPPGTTIGGRYVLGRVLGEGGFGITYLAWDTKYERKVAIKEYYPRDEVTRASRNSHEVSCIAGASKETFEEEIEKFQDEAKRLAQMHKRDVAVKVYDDAIENGTAYIVMEYIEGVTLSEVIDLRGGRIEPDELFCVMEPLFDALILLHEKDIIHRDISPDNIMIEDGLIRLIDFGCAREGTRGTRELTVRYKDGYAPIEQYNGWGQGTWTDVYALCATIYKCLTGVTPLPARERLIKDELVSPTKLGVNISVDQEHAILHGLRVQPRRRPQTITKLKAELYRQPSKAEAFLNNKRTQLRKKMPSSVAIRRIKRASIAIVIVLFCLLAWHLWDERPRKSPPFEDVVAISAGGYHTVGVRSDGTVAITDDELLGNSGVYDWQGIVGISAGPLHTVGLRDDGTVIASDYAADDYDAEGGACDVSDWSDIVAVDAGGTSDQPFTIGLLKDGEVVATGANDVTQCNVGAWEDIVAVAAGDYHTVGLRRDGRVIATGDNSNGQLEVSEWRDITAVAAGTTFTVGLRSDGTVVATGDYGEQLGAQGWQDIVAISSGGYDTVGLRSDGTVAAFGVNEYDELDVAVWTDIVAVSAAGDFTVGLKSDGTLLATGDNLFGRCRVSGESDVVDIAAGNGFTVGLRSNGNLLAAGSNGDGQCDIHTWTDIIAIATGEAHTVGLRVDGVVYATGDNSSGQCEVSEWKDITTLSASLERTVGLQADGTLAVAGYCGEPYAPITKWTELVAVADGGTHVVGLRANGTVVAAGYNDDGECDVDDWTNIVAIAATDRVTYGLRSDGTVVATGSNEYGMCNVLGFTNIESLAAGNLQVVGLRSDGTVAAAGFDPKHTRDVSTWSNVSSIAAGAVHTVGLMDDGSLRAVGADTDGCCDLSSWYDM